MEPGVMVVSMQWNTNVETDEDQAFVRATKNGDVSAFEQLVQKYDRTVMRIAQSITRSREEAEDTAQEVFFKVYQKLEQFHENAKFSTWLTRIAVNESLTRLRKSRALKLQSLDSFNPNEGESEPLEIADWIANPEDRYSAFEMREILSNALESLQRGLRVVFVLRDIEGLSVRETAEVLGLSLVAVRTRLFRARLQLREKLSKYLTKQGG